MNNQSHLSHRSEMSSFLLKVTTFPFRAFVPSREMGLSLIIAGTLTGCDGPGKGGPIAPIVGPKLERLVSQMRSSALSDAEKETYLRKMHGRLVSATGNVVSNSGVVVLDCELEKTHEHVFARAELKPEKMQDLPGLKPKQYITVTGLLDGPTTPSPDYGAEKQPIRLRDCFIRIR
jgi:hypothetical protein